MSGTVIPTWSPPRSPGMPLPTFLLDPSFRDVSNILEYIGSCPGNSADLALIWMHLAGSLQATMTSREMRMPRVKRVATGSEWNELSTTAADWKAADPGLLAAMLGQLHLIRAFEETVLELAGEGLVHGPAHSSIGQEGGAVGSIVSLRSTDAVNGSHRGHHQFLAKALTHVTKGAGDLERLVTPEVAEVLQRTLAEILGLAQGYCAGRGGSMHLQWLEAGALGTNAIVGGGVPMATGNAWAQKNSARQHADGTDLTVTYFGDGAVNIGSVLESLNLAA